MVLFDRSHTISYQPSIITVIWQDIGKTANFSYLICNWCPY